MRHISVSSFKLLFICTAVLLCFNSRAHALLIDSVDANIAVVDFGAPTSFSFFFSKPTAGLTGLFTSTLTISGTLTDATGDGVAIGLGSLPAIAQATIEGIGVIDLGPISSSAGAYGPYTLSTIIDSADYGGTIDQMGLSIAFQLSGNDDQVAFSATHTLETVESRVPLPATLVLFASALVGLGWSRRRRPGKRRSPGRRGQRIIARR